MQAKSDTKVVFVQVVERPKRKLILKRGTNADNYYDYCEELGCDIWGELCSIKQALYEPIGMWLPENLQKPGTSKYAQGVEVPFDYQNDLPEGYEIIDLPACKVMVFQGPPFKDEEFEAAINDLWQVMDNYNPELYGFRWADEDGPRFQLAPMGWNGDISKPARCGPCNIPGTLLRRLGVKCQSYLGFQKSTLGLTDTNELFSANLIFYHSV